MTRFKKGVLLFSTVLFIFSCVTTAPVRESEVPNLDEATMIRLEKLLADDEVFAVLQDLTTLERENPDRWNGAYENLRGRTEQRLEDMLAREEEKGDWSRALMLFRSLQAVKGDEDFSREAELSLMMKGAEALFQEGSVIPSLVSFGKILDYPSIDTDLLILWAERARAEGHRALVTQIVGYLESRNEPVPPDLTEWETKNRPPRS